MITLELTPPPPLGDTETLNEHSLYNDIILQHISNVYKCHTCSIDTNISIWEQSLFMGGGGVKRTPESGAKQSFECDRFQDLHYPPNINNDHSLSLGSALICVQCFGTYIKQKPLKIMSNKFPR